MPYRPPRRNLPEHRINQYIRVPEVRLIGSDDKQIGVVKTEEALQQARDAGLDLVEIAGKAKPPVVKIVDYNKFLYRESKKKQAQAKKTKKGGMKEIRLTPFIGDADLDVRVKRIEEFFEDNYKVRVNVRFTGRQMGQKEYGYKVVARLLEKLGDKAKVEREPKFIGRRLMATITSA